MVAIYLMMRSFMRLQSSGTLDYGNAVGVMGTIYVTVPPVQRAGGQVEIMIQGRLVTAEALQKGTEPIQPGTKVTVVERIGTSTLIVEPLT
jgi:membrane protein implicated in regulation of membrane protease activity